MPPVPMLNPTPSGPSPGLCALLETSAFAALDSSGWLRVTGDDRVRWLNGMVTNSIQALTAGEGCYSFALNAQGRIQGDLIAWLQPDDILLETSRPQSLQTWLERYIIMDDVELSLLAASAAEPSEAERTIPADGRRGLLLAGPQAEFFLRDLLGDTDLPEPLHFLSAEWDGGNVQVFHAPSPLVPRFGLWFGDAQARDRYASALATGKVGEATEEDLDHLRLLEGTPLFGTDIRDKDLPQETGQTSALHFSKGCYLGQEIVERIHSRGAVHRTFSGFKLTGALPPAGTQIFAQDAPGKAVGEFTCAATIALRTGSVAVGLGYIRREVLEHKAALPYAGGSAIPVQLPFRLGAGNEPDIQESASEVSAGTSPPGISE